MSALPSVPARSIETMPIRLVVNGRPREIEVAVHHTLLEVLRDDLDLTGTKECCLVGECGACTVRLDGQIVDSCLVLAVEADGGEVTTVEGLAPERGPNRLQEAFLDHGAVQCGFCTPGQLMAADDLLRRTPHPSVAEIQDGLAGNLCRCGCYEQITEAVLHAAGRPARPSTPDMPAAGRASTDVAKGAGPSAEAAGR